MLARQRARQKLRSTFVAIREMARKRNFCRRVDMEKFATKFSLAQPCDGKTAWKITAPHRSTGNYF
jgi:hypothetical protein